MSASSAATATPTFTRPWWHEVAVDVAAVGAWVRAQRQRRRLDDEVVERGGDVPLVGLLAHLRAEGDAASIATSVCTWNSGTVDFASTMRRAMSAWSRVGRVTVGVPREESPASRGAGAGADGASPFVLGCGAAIPAAWRTSRRVIRPRGPVPASAASETPCARATRWASGVATAGDSRRTGAGADVGVGAGAARRDIADLADEGADTRDRLADGERGALGGRDLEDPLGLGLVGHRRLVGLDLDEVLALGDRLSVVDEPAEDRPVLHRIREPGHLDVGHGRLQVRRSMAAPTIVSTSMPKAR